MNVLLDGLQAGNHSGTGSYTCALIRELPIARPDLALHVVAPDSTQGLFDPASLASLASCPGGPFPLGTFRRSIAMAGVLKRLKPDILHYPANIGRQVGTALRSRTKVVLTVHDLTFLREPGWFRFDRAAYYRATIKKSVRRATRIIADSQATAEDLQNLLDVDPAIVDVTPLGVDARFRPASEDEVARVRERYALPDTFFLYLGTLEPRKNIPRIINAWDRTAMDCAEHLVVAGREGWKVAPIHQAAAEATHHARLHFPGFIDEADLPAILSASTAFIWPSLWEGFGLPPLEAMACGAPVLTSNTSSLPEVVGEAALTVDPEDTEAIAEGLRALSSDQALRDRLRTAGLERAADFTWKRTAEMTYEVYCRTMEMA